MITMKNTKAQMFAEIERLNAELAEAKNVAVEMLGNAIQSKRPMPQWQRERADQMARAKAQAMACGQTVKV